MPPVSVALPILPFRQQQRCCQSPVFYVCAPDLGSAPQGRQTGSTPKAVTIGTAIGTVKTSIDIACMNMPRMMGLIPTILASGLARKVLGLMLATLTVALFLLNIRRTWERAGRMA